MCEMIPRTVEETVLHLYSLSVRGFQRMSTRFSRLLRIMQLLHETSVLLYSGNAEGLGLSADSIDKMIIRYGCCADGTLDFRGITECDSFIGGLERN